MSNPVRRRRAERYAEIMPDAAAVPAAPTAEDDSWQDAAGPVEMPDIPADMPAEEPAQAPIPPARDLLATNTGVRLACTMAAMIGLFAIFLCWAEQESRVIRRFSVQSAALTAAHAAVGLGALLISALLGGIPYLGLMVSLVCLLGYITALILLVILRVRLMKHAWDGVRCDLPGGVERFISRYY